VCDGSAVVWPTGNPPAVERLSSGSAPTAELEKSVVGVAAMAIAVGSETECEPVGHEAESVPDGSKISSEPVRQGVESEPVGSEISSEPVKQGVESEPVGLGSESKSMSQGGEPQLVSLASKSAPVGLGAHLRLSDQASKSEPSGEGVQVVEEGVAAGSSLPAESTASADCSARAAPTQEYEALDLGQELADVSPSRPAPSKDGDDPLVPRMRGAKVLWRRGGMAARLVSGLCKRTSEPKPEENDFKAEARRVQQELDAYKSEAQALLEHVREEVLECEEATTTELAKLEIQLRGERHRARQSASCAEQNIDHQRAAESAELEEAVLQAQRSSEAHIEELQETLAVSEASAKASARSLRAESLEAAALAAECRALVSASEHHYSATALLEARADNCLLVQADQLRRQDEATAAAAREKARADDLARQVLQLQEALDRERRGAVQREWSRVGQSRGTQAIVVELREALADRDEQIVALQRKILGPAVAG